MEVVLLQHPLQGKWQVEQHSKFSTWDLNYDVDFFFKFLSFWFWYYFWLFGVGIAQDLENMELYFPVLENLVMSVESIGDTYEIF